MERNWAALGAALRSAREALGPTQAEMGARIGIGRDALRSIESGDGKRVTKSIRAFAREVGWTEGSVEDVLHGRAPTLVGATEPVAEKPHENSTLESSRRYAKGMPARIELELSEGEVLDTEIIDLSLPGSSAKLVLVAKVGASDASDEQKRADLLEWTRIRRKLLDIAAEEVQEP